MSNVIEQLLKSIQEAAEQIDAPFFKVPTVYDAGGIVRERAFCYELYHQIRLRMSAKEFDVSTTLHGEIDKKGHGAFAKEDWKNPDFIFHTPGEMGENNIVIEVKGTLVNPKNVVKDFGTLNAFVQRYGYRLGLFLLYNHSMAEFYEAMPELLNEYAGSGLSIIAIKKSHDACELTRL